jgi:excisionase family DNA binding protein
MLTVPEAARRVGRHPETIRRWIRQGRLRSEKVGTQHVVREEDLETVARPDTLDLPQAWSVTDDGVPMPAWERIVRDNRRSH